MLVIVYCFIVWARVIFNVWLVVGYDPVFVLASAVVAPIHRIHRIQH